MPAKTKSTAKDSTATIGFEAKLWLTDDKPRDNMDAAEPSGARQTATGNAKGERGGVHQFGVPPNGDVVYRKEAWQFLLNGGSGKAFRRQMKVLKDFVEAFDFVRMKPARELIKADGAVAYALAEAGKSYAAYFKGKAQNASLDLPAGDYRASWVNVTQGNIEKAEDFTHAGGEKTLAAPEYKEEIALKVQKVAAAK